MRSSPDFFRLPRSSVTASLASVGNPSLGLLWLVGGRLASGRFRGFRRRPHPEQYGPRLMVLHLACGTGSVSSFAIPWRPSAPRAVRTPLLPIATFIRPLPAAVQPLLKPRQRWRSISLCPDDMASISHDAFVGSSLHTWPVTSLNACLVGPWPSGFTPRLMRPAFARPSGRRSVRGWDSLNASLSSRSRNL